MQAVYKTFYWIFMVAVVGLGLLLMLSLIPISGFKIKIVKSGSMEPAIMTGAIVVDHPEPSYTVGDVITFGADTKVQIPTTHRIYAVNTDGGQTLFTTKGDANDAPDPVQTPLAAVHGKVVYSVPYLGYMLAFARQPMGFALLVGLPAALIIFEEIGKIVREVRRLRRKKITLHATEPEQQHYRPRVD